MDVVKRQDGFERERRAVVERVHGDAVRSAFVVAGVATVPLVETAAGVTRRSLRHDRVRGVEIAINVYKPRTASATEPVAHDGCEFGVVLDGILEVTVGGRIHKLQKGDLISYPSTEPHRFANTSSSPARTIWLNLKRDPMQ